MGARVEWGKAGFGVPCSGNFVPSFVASFVDQKKARDKVKETS